MPKKAEHEIVCVAQFIAKEGKEDELLHTLHSLIAPTHEEEGCIRYELNQAIDNPRNFTFIEKFKSQAAFDIHRNAPQLGKVLKEIAPPLIESFTVTLFHEIMP